ncbi:MAG: DUF58 domain-containing protein [Acidimicrobiales bacterium]|nr:DUF58 domain-containing protein [Acidimicrobiales bacterium]MCB9372725.1 DUF58 domain-containing protein [Microthrixaceae bacterium]
MLPVPTRRLALVAALAAAVVLALDVDRRLLLVDGVLLVLAAVDWALAPRPDRVAVERDLPGVLALGGRGEVVWHLDNPLGRPLRVALADDLAPSLRPRTRRIRVRIPRRGRAEGRTTIHPARRGRFELGRVTLRVEGPLGLAARQRRVPCPGLLRVFPPFRSRDEAELRINKARILEVGLRSAQGRGGGTEFDQLREYSVDDEFRRIDWSATARAGRAIVRTYRAERNQTVLLLLDNGRVMAGRVDDVPRVEHAMDAVMMMTAVATRLGDRCGLVAFDRRVQRVVGPAQSRTQLARVTEAMYELEPQLAESDYAGAFAETLARFRRRAMLVILTDLVEQAVGESLLPALPLIVRNHLVVVAGVADPDVVGWAASSPRDASGAYRKTAAVRALEERRRTVARLRGLGAHVVDAPPGQLAPRLADTYLAVKATGRL